jgi:predicted phage terminase large subunit-like protein
VSQEWNTDAESRLAELLQYEEEAEPFRDYINRISPRLPPPRHLNPLMDVWERTRHGPVYAVIELPPRHAKTTTALHGFGWRMMLDPSLRNAFIAYAESLSLEKSRIARRLARASGVKLQQDSQAVSFWETEEGGSFLATSIGGGITGKGLTGVAVIDDPHKDRAEAESVLLRDKVWDWFTDTFWTRLEDECSVLIIQTRWHKDDLAGRVLKGFEDPATGEKINFERIRLPALAEKDDPLDREVGEALWPERFPAKKLHGIRSIMGPYGFSSLYQQAPISKGKQIFKDHPSRFKMADWKLDGHRILISCDPAASEKQSADYSAVVVCAAKGYAEDMEMWVIDHFRMQLQVPHLVKHLLRMQKQWWGVAVGVESVGAFKAVPQIMRMEAPRLKVLEIVPVGDKWQRAQAAGSAWSEDRIHVPTDVEWAEEFMDELTDFSPAAKVDDQVDALSHGWNTLFEAKRPRRRGPRRSNRLPFG